jgi:hypothetical protein
MGISKVSIQYRESLAAHAKQLGYAPQIYPLDEVLNGLNNSIPAIAPSLV